MKNLYSNPQIDVKLFETEILLTASGSDEPLSADNKAREALETKGTTEIVTIAW